MKDTTDQAPDVSQHLVTLTPDEFRATRGARRDARRLDRIARGRAGPGDIAWLTAGDQDPDGGPS